ncbi:type II toxin-antitoxin system Phd/YefM family antitoxin [Geotalea uraniireducens]|uniref:Antitoxin n=1 Tax=Geotalea uraniireducens (strain Rf4) TaxID=351605 RepID=A5GE32_GEOUR|nr:type II toxin-antitoxin system Phd/YefM family antitoxin [Geotalea uraniireducens]ABQ25687.1 prevent-host-death family protein [Geotalea uraniireducens Rf4]
MKMSEAVKPISYFKSHASEVVRDVVETHRPVVITLNGEAKAIVQDLREYEKTGESLALLKILAMGQKDVEEGKTRPFRTAFADIRSGIKKERS